MITFNEGETVNLETPPSTSGIVVSHDTHVPKLLLSARHSVLRASLPGKPHRNCLLSPFTDGENGAKEGSKRASELSRHIAHLMAHMRCSLCLERPSPPFLYLLYK